MANLQVNNQQNGANWLKSASKQMEYRLNHKLFVTHLTQIYILKQKDWLQDAGPTNPDFFWLKTSIDCPWN